ncbi:MAG: NIPSNAP family protein [Actinomycetota bacterium]
MKRRGFLAGTAAVAGSELLGGVAEAQGGGKGGKQVLELRRYTFASDGKRAAFEGFCESGLIPALNRAGVRPVGVFRMTKADNPQAAFAGETSPELFILLPHSSLESVTGLDAKLAADSAYGAALAGLGDAPKDPAYARIESSLLTGFDQCPRVETPVKGPSRVLQLRIYESASAERARLKERMFNEGGEIRIFRESGLAPVFFGQAITGTRLPNITYMVAFENDEALKAGWAKFLKHPDWEKLKADPTYKDTVSNITNLVLRPAGGSQI